MSTLYTILFLGWIMLSKSPSLGSIIVAMHALTMGLFLPGYYFIGFYGGGYQIQSIYSFLIFDLLVFIQLIITTILVRDVKVEKLAGFKFTLRSPFFNSYFIIGIAIIAMCFFTILMRFWGLEPYYLSIFSGSLLENEYISRSDRTEGQGAFLFSFTFDYIIPALCLNSLATSKNFIVKSLAMIILIASVLSMGTKFPIIVVLIWLIFKKLYDKEWTINWKFYLRGGFFLGIIFIFYLLVKMSFGDGQPYENVGVALYSFIRRILAGSVIAGLVGIDYFGLDFFNGVENLKPLVWSLVYGRMGGSATLPILVNIMISQGLILGFLSFSALCVLIRYSYAYILTLSHCNPQYRTMLLFPFFQLMITFAFSGHYEFMLRLIGILVFVMLLHFIGKLKFKRKRQLEFK